MDSEVDDVQDLGGEEVVDAVEVGVGGYVCLHVLLDFSELCDEKALDVEDDGEDTDAMVDMVFQFVDGGRDVDLLFCETADVFTVNPPLPSEVLSERAIVSAVSDTMLADCAGTRKKEKLEGLS